MGSAKVKTVAMPKRHVPVQRRGQAQYRPVLQPSLRVGAVNDPAEREAEVMAARVVASSAPSHSVSDAGGSPRAEGPVAPLRRNTDSQPTTDDLVPEAAPSEQQDFDLPETENVDTGGMDISETSEIDSGEPIDTSGEPPAPESPPIEDAPPPIAALRRSDAPAAVVGRMGGEAPQDVSNIVAHPGPGRPLSSGLRQRVEPHFGTSFKNVRVHATPSDQAAAARIGARAFTHGNHIWLGKGESETNTRLMAHELTHVVQQTEGAETLPMNRTPARRKGVIRRGWLTDKAESAARHVPGYTLITVIVGKKLISGKKVERNATNLLGGLFGLVPGGTLLFDRLKEARVIEEAYKWVQEQLTELNLTWARVKNTIEELYDGLVSWSPIKNAKRILGSLVRDIITFVKRITMKVLEFIIRGALKLAGPYAEKIWGILKSAGETISLILENPLQFGMNLLKAVVGGFTKFGVNILTHLKNGILGWLFGALTGAGIEMPEKMNFKGIMSIVMQVLGLTYANFRARLVKKLGPSGEKKVSMIEKSVEIVKVLIKEGFAGIWQKLLEMIDNFKQTFVGEMIKMVTETVIRAGLGWLAGLSNPVGAVVKVVLAIYDIIKTFLERLDQILDVAQAIFSSVGAIAKGQLSKAIDFVEATIGKTVPVVISFLAALLGLGGISSKIKNVIKKLQAPVNKAMDKLIGFVIKKAKKLFAKLLGKVNGKRKFPSRNFKIGKTQHRIFGQQKGKKVEVMIASGNPQPHATHIAAQKTELEKFQETQDKRALAFAQAIDKALAESKKETEDEADDIDPKSTKKSTQKDVEELDKELLEAGEELFKAAKDLDSIEWLSSDVKGSGLYRAAAPRVIELEGNVGTYDELKAQGKEPYNSTIKTPRSRFYDMDHTIEKRYPKDLLKNLRILDEKDDGQSTPAATTPVLRDGTPPAPSTGADGGGAGDGASKAAGSLGQLGDTINEVDEDATTFPAVALYHGNHLPKKGRGLPEPVDLLKAAKASKEKDKYLVARRMLKAQLDQELKDLTDIHAKDPQVQASPIKAKIDKALVDLRKRNNKIYGLSYVKADRGKSKDSPDAGKHAIAGGSELRFNDKINGQEFGMLEGRGVLYGKRETGETKKYLEYDHILDQAFGEDASQHPIVNENQAKEVEEEAQKLMQGGQKQIGDWTRKDNLRKLQIKRSLYNGNPKMYVYNPDNWYSVPLWERVAKRVSGAMAGSSVKTITNDPITLPATAKTALAKYTLVGDKAEKKKGRNEIRDLVKARLQSRLDAHASQVRNHYKHQLQYVADINPNNKDDATKAMKNVITNVYASLHAANAQANSMFD